MAAPVLRPLSTGEVLDTAFGLYRSLFFPLVTVALICRTVPVVMSVYLRQVSGTDPMAIFDHWRLFLCYWAVATLLNVVAVAATTTIVAGAYLGQPMAAGTALRKALRLIGPLVLLAFLSALAIILGLIALIIPGVILWSGLLLATTVLVIEQPVTAIEAMNRSWTLTKGFRFKVFVTVLVALLLVLIPGTIVGVVSAAGTLAGATSTIAPAIATGLLQVFVYPFIYIVVTVLYYDLRVRKEGFDLELLAVATQPAT